MSDKVVQVRNLSRRFGHTQALDNVNIDLLPGYVYGLVGGNGQGKTTLIKHLLGLLKAHEGSVEVLGMDPVKQPVQVLQRIGYLSEERELPDWMRVRELLNYTAAFHSAWDAAYADELLATFGLEEQKKIRQLSKGMRAQAGLIAAVAHRPPLLLLDEPSTGLDAIVRRDILNAIVRAVADEQRTVLFSSHLLDEVEQMSDFVFMIDSGRVVLQGELDAIKHDHRRWLIHFSEPRASFPRMEGVLSAECKHGLWSVVCNGSRPDFLSLIQAAGGSVREERAVSLQEIYLARVSRRGARPEA